MNESSAASVRETPKPQAKAVVSRIRVRYAETDQMGVVYYANYYVWFEVGRTDLLRSAGGSYRDMEKDGLQLPVIESHCEYRQPARYDDDLELRTTGSIVSPVRVKFSYELVRPKDNVTLATGHTIHAALDMKGKPRRLPDSVKTLMRS